MISQSSPAMRLLATAAGPSGGGASWKLAGSLSQPPARSQSSVSSSSSPTRAWMGLPYTPITEVRLPITASSSAISPASLRSISGTGRPSGSTRSSAVSRAAQMPATAEIAASNSAVSGANSSVGTARISPTSAPVAPARGISLSPGNSSVPPALVNSSAPGTAAGTSVHRPPSAPSAIQTTPATASSHGSGLRIISWSMPASLSGI